MALSDDAARQQFDVFFPRLKGFFIRRGVGSDEAQDLAQEVLTRAFSRWSSFRGQAQRETWIYTIARNVLFNSRRAQHTQKRHAETVPLAEEGPLEPRDEGQASQLREVLAREHLALVRQAMDELPPQMRRCVQLYHDGGLKYRQIAEVLGISINTVKSQLHQARQQLERAVGERFAEGDEAEPGDDGPRVLVAEPAPAGG